MTQRAARARLFCGAGLMVSLCAHAALALALARGGTAHAVAKQLSPVQIAVVTSEPPAIAAPEPTPPAAEQPAIRRSRRLTKAAPPPIVAAKAPAVSPPAAVDLTGVTLTNAGPGASFSMAAGNGLASDQPIRAGKARDSAHAAPSSAPASAPPSEVSASDLARRPMPPALDGVLRNHYPEGARRRGIGGTAVVRVRVDPDGRVRRASIVTESAQGFGAACQKTVQGSRWSPPLDREGHLVATNVTYACRFQVEE